MFFGAADRVLTEVTDASTDDDVAVVILRLSQLRMVDATGRRRSASSWKGWRRAA